MAKPADRILKVFEGCDGRGDGCIDVVVFKKLLSLLDSTFWTDAEIQQLWSVLGIEAEERINCKEIVDWIWSGSDGVCFKGGRSIRPKCRQTDCNISARDALAQLIGNLSARRLGVRTIRLKTLWKLYEAAAGLHSVADTTLASAHAALLQEQNRFQEAQSILLGYLQARELGVATIDIPALWARYREALPDLDHSMSLDLQRRIQLFEEAVGYSPQADVDKAWAKAHETLPDPKARVDYEHFYEAVKHLNRDDEKHDAFDKFAKQVFRTGTAFMASDWQDWNDLGKHCFSYAYLMANEFYDDKPRDNLGLTLKATERPQDQTEAIRKECDQAWETVQKDGDGRVTWEAFKVFFINKYGENLNSESKPHYENFLKQLFTTNLAMMLPAKKDTLGGHCFRYGALMAGEFYFDAAKGAGGCGTPVTDVLGLTK